MGKKHDPKPDPEGQRRVRRITGKKPSGETVRRAGRDYEKRVKREQKQKTEEIERIKNGDVRPHPNSKRRQENE